MNINEIAELAGVSRATVSRYLNDGYVSEEKRAAIRKVIEETGYRPSQQARNLRSKVTKLVGVIIPEIESGSVSQMVSGISEVLSVKGYQLLLADTRTFQISGDFSTVKQPVISFICMANHCRMNSPCFKLTHQGIPLSGA